MQLYNKRVTKILVTAILLSSLVWPLRGFAQPYRYLVLKGGGIRGIAYTGALKVLEEKDITPGIEKVAGTSSGAIVGALLCVGYTASELEEIMFSLDIAGFNDGSWFFLGGLKRMRRNFGWYKGNRLENWIGRKIKEKTGDENITFMQLHQLARKDHHYKDLYAVATDLSAQRREVFSWETFPHLPVKVAVRASMSIPMYFGAVFLDSTGQRGRQGDGRYHLYIDGGMVANYPLNVFTNEKDATGNTISDYTLGLKLERPEQIEFVKDHKGVAPYDIQSISDYIAALYNIDVEQHTKTVTFEEERKHTIYISNGNLGPRPRYISPEQKLLLYNNGAEAARDFFEKK